MPANTTKTIAFIFSGILSAFPGINSYAQDRARNRSTSGTIASTSSDSMSMQMPLVAPLFLEGRGFASTVVLANPLIRSISVEVVVRRLDGIQSVAKTVTVPPRSQSRTTVASLLGYEPSTLESGSVLVIPQDAVASTVAGLLSVAFTGSSAPSYIDEEFVMPTTHSSRYLRGVAIESSGPPLIGITSISSQLQTVSLDCLSRGRRTKKLIRLYSGETAITQACEAREWNNDIASLDDTNSSQGSQARGDTVAVALESDGGPGQYAAFGISHDLFTKAGSQLYGPVPFIDPIGVQSTNTIFTGVPIGSISELPGNYAPRLAVANFGAATAKIEVVYAKSLDDPSLEPVVRTALEFSLGPGATNTMPLDGLDGSPDLADSLIVSSSGKPGDVVANLASVSSDPLMQMFVLGHDERDAYNSGKHPWHIENIPDSDAVLLLFNHSEQPQELGVSIGNNGVLWSKRLKLSPKRTSAISIRKLIQGKVKDDQGRTLRSELQDGEITWSLPKSGQAKGRLLESSTGPLTARSFSCTGVMSMCDNDTWTQDPNVTVDVGATVTMGTLTFYECDSGDPYTPCCNCADGNIWYGGVGTAWAGCNHSTGCTQSGGPSNTFTGSTDGVDNITTTSTDGICTSTDGGQVAVAHCPSSVSIKSITQIPLEQMFPTYLTGLGIVAAMQVGGSSSVSYNNSTVTEGVSVNYVMPNNCPPRIFPECPGSDTFDVGAPGSAFDVPFPPINNVFYDGHFLWSGTSLLDQAGLSQCTFSCNQVYYAGHDPNGNSCAGVPIGGFLITYSFSRDTINGTHVTRTAVTKQ